MEIKMKKPSLLSKKISSNLSGKIRLFLLITILLTSTLTSIYAAETETYTPQIGEKLTFDVKALGIKAVDVVFEVMGKDTVKDFPVYHIRCTAKTIPIFSKLIYNVDNVYEVYVDQTTLLPRNFSRKIRQGKEDHYDQDIYFWIEKNAAYYDKNYAMKIPAATFEFFSAFYYLRQRADLSIGDTLRLDALSDKILWQIDIVAEAKETIEVSDEEYDTVRYKFDFSTEDDEKTLENRPPDLFLKNIFGCHGTAHLWLSDDEKRIPVKAEFKRSPYTLSLTLKKSETTHRDSTEILGEAK